MKLLKKPAVLVLIAKSNSTLYSDIKQGLMIPPVSQGENSVAWPEHEITAINQARVAGYSDDQVRELVKALLAKRKAIDPMAALSAATESEA